MEIGDLVEDFALPSTDGEFRLSDCRGRAVVLYFYPKDDTPGCTLEGREFSALLPEFESAGVEIAGVSRDSVRAHEKFCAKYDYAHRLISDADELLCGRFGVIKNKTMFGKPARGIARGTFLIGKDGRLARAWRDIKDIEGHAAEVLAAAKEL
ncbi:MAG: peroxiredoxin [Betaproteobacteria bacterium]|nr:peroxiredoxin [Betaproteobacteria bacterium]